MESPRFGVTSKLFLAILATCIIVTIAMGMAVRFSFERGFRHYTDERETRRAEAITAILADYYREAGDWDELRHQTRRWWRLLRSIPDTGAHQGERPPNPMPVVPPSYALLDARGNTIVNAGPGPGSVPRGSQRHAIEVDGSVVGWLAVPPRPSAISVIDERFAAQQLKATWLISALSVVIAAIVSVLLARSLIAPLRRLGRATHRLAGGDYATRVAANSRDELGQLARDFNHLALTLESNERMRRDMVADISHELRTPLAILQGELEAMQDGVRALTPASLSSLQTEVATLKKLIDDLYELSLADVGAMHYRMTSVDAGTLLEAVCASYRERMAAGGLTLHTQISPHTPPIHGDPQRLTQLFNNLLENSLRYTDPQGQTWVRLHVQGNELEIVVEDSAPGVPNELLPRLFERMFRVDPSRSRESGGSGLGLALAARIVEAHGGNIQALASPLGGVRILMHFPLLAA
ncbi:HAMP domain-containing protein [Pusillimonas sp. CC-YST705]|uniref:histidine kinase n=1 Tax=Mesopusillimonas faecipullorum TaxID=2755040 RepID=A0ABS8C9R3_9BURK|nr:ATP-binding protein [Mesopusillimonas faecipullorum]MCB5362770.1 HAMP domain-containing protein [Mesopusillimonas faecipullorum]